MKKATNTEAKNQANALVDRVKNGAIDDTEGRRTRLERQGGIRLETTAPPCTVILEKLPKFKKPSGVLATLLDERLGGR